MPEKTKTNVTEINELKINTKNQEFIINIPKSEEKVPKKEGNES